MIIVNSDSLRFYASLAPRVYPETSKREQSLDTKHSAASTSQSTWTPSRSTFLAICLESWVWSVRLGFHPELPRVPRFHGSQRRGVGRKHGRAGNQAGDLHIPTRAMNIWQAPMNVCSPCWSEQSDLSQPEKSIGLAKS